MIKDVSQTVMSMANPTNYTQAVQKMASAVVKNVVTWEVPKVADL
jgi:hypothetical protein